MVTDQLDVLTFGDLKRNDKRVLFWGLLWRGFFAAVGMYLAGFVLGAILGFLTVFTMRSMGYDQNSAMHTLPFITGPAGLVLGIWLSWLYIHWILRIRIGHFGLRVVRFDGKPAT